VGRRIESHLLPGPAGRLEALLEEPEEREPGGAALVCHPHPLHGGTLHNKATHRLARGLRRSGHATLRFNFRGVNLSEGVHGQGHGEVEDAWAALAFLRARYPRLPYVLAGFSFGSRVALKLAGRLWAPLPRLVIAAGFPTVYPGRGFLERVTAPMVFIQSAQDEFGPLEELRSVVEAPGSRASLLEIEAQDHFFGGALGRFEQAVADLTALPG
jgi:alpha/beta superfamily hydrolase